MIPTKIKNTQNAIRAVLMPETKDRRAFGKIVSEGVKSSVNGVSEGFKCTQSLVRRTAAVTEAAEFDIDVRNDAIGGFGSPLGSVLFALRRTSREFELHYAFSDFTGSCTPSGS